MLRHRHLPLITLLAAWNLSMGLSLGASNPVDPAAANPRPLDLIYCQATIQSAVTTMFTRARGNSIFQPNRIT